MENSLQHFGIPGMKWGRRRYQNEDGSLTSAGKKRYERYEKTSSSLTSKRAKNYISEGSKKRIEDERAFGQRGVERIAKRIDKGDKYQTAVTKEAVRNLSKIAAAAALGGLSYQALTSGKGKEVFGKVINFGKKVYNNYYDMSVLDSNGNVLKRYHKSYEIGKEVVGALIKR